MAREHELVISHGNGPQVGLLALQASAYTAVEAYPLDVLGAQTEGMIGYVLQQELGNELPFEKRIATLLTQIEVDRDDPAFGDPTKPIGPIYARRRGGRARGREGLGRSSPTGRACAASSPSPEPRRIFGVEPIEWLLENGCVVICAGGGGIPVDVHGRAGAGRPPARRRRGGDRQGPGQRAAGASTSAPTCSRSSPTSTPSTPAGARREQQAIRRASPDALATTEFAAGSMGPKVRAACRFVEQTGGLAVIGSIADTAALRPRRGRDGRRGGRGRARARRRELRRSVA